MKIKKESVYCFFTYGRSSPPCWRKKTPSPPDRRLIFFDVSYRIVFFRNGFKTKKTAPQRFETLERSDRYEKTPATHPPCLSGCGGGKGTHPPFLSVSPPPRPSFPPNNEAFFFVFCLPRPADDIIKRNLYLGRLTKLSNANLGERKKMPMSVAPLRPADLFCYDFIF